MFIVNHYDAIVKSHILHFSYTACDWFLNKRISLHDRIEEKAKVKDYSIKIVDMKIKLITRLFILTYIGTSIFCKIKGQEAKNSGLKIYCSIPKIVDSNENALITISLVSSGRGKFFVFDSLFYGDYVSKFANFYIVLERKVNKYREYTNKTFFDSYPTNDSVIPSPHKILLPGTSVIYRYHLDNVYQLKKGQYRIKCFYRNNLSKDEKIASTWVYFIVNKPIDVKHDY